MEIFACAIVALVILAVIKAVVNPFVPPKGFELDKHGNIRCCVCRKCDFDHAPDACPKQQELF